MIVIICTYWSHLTVQQQSHNKINLINNHPLARATPSEQSNTNISAQINIYPISGPQQISKLITRIRNSSFHHHTKQQQQNETHLNRKPLLLLQQNISQQAPLQQKEPDELFPLWNTYQSIDPPLSKAEQRLKKCCSRLNEADSECKKRFCGFDALEPRTVSIY